MELLEHRRGLLSRLLRGRPVIASLFTADDIEAFTATDAPACILANADLRSLESLVSGLREKGRFVFVNLDSIAGLASDAGGIDFLAGIGVDGTVTTRGTIISRVQARQMVAVQKLFVTDRLNLPRATQAVASAQPGYVQIMPAPVLPYIRDEPIMTVSPVLAGGFISTPRDVIAALACGATGVSTSARALWTYKKEQQ